MEDLATGGMPGDEHFEAEGLAETLPYTSTEEVESVYMSTEEEEPEPVYKWEEEPEPASKPEGEFTQLPRCDIGWQTSTQGGSTKGFVDGVLCGIIIGVLATVTFFHTYSPVP